MFLVEKDLTNSNDEECGITPKEIFVEAKCFLKRSGCV